MRGREEYFSEVAEQSFEEVGKEIRRIFVCLPTFKEEITYVLIALSEL